MAGQPASRLPRCGARTRGPDKHRCRAPPVIDRGTGRPRNGRCRLHGGLSTGPRTPAGRATIAASQRKHWWR
ncbi:MAG: HGGxSTG domain-containing protein [Alphaproteobacteria bacterium]